MSEFKHTPGPWFVYRDEICYRSDADDQSYGMMCPVDFEKEANARLMAAAPDLLEVLQAIEAMHSHDQSIGDAAMALYEASCMARAAIAKATGGQE